jgi:hypothetical protein
MKENVSSRLCSLSEICSLEETFFIVSLIFAQFEVELKHHYMYDGRNFVMGT